MSRYQYLKMVILFVSIWLLLSYPSFSETKNWSISLHLGGIFGGPSAEIGNEMKSSGFVSIKEKRWHAPSWMIGIKRDIKGPFSTGIFLSKTHLGKTEGILPPQDNLNLKYTILSISPVFSINQSDTIRFSIGPSIYFSETHQNFPKKWMTHDDSKNTKFGFIVDAGIRFPAHTRLFFEFNLQFRKVGKVKVESVVIEKETGYDLWWEGIFMTPDVSFDHLLMTVGIGMRI